MADALDDLIFGDEPRLIQAQAPVRRPAPVERPGAVERPGSSAPPRAARPAPRALPAPAPRQAEPQTVAPEPVEGTGRFQFKPQGAPAMRPYQLSPQEADELIFGDGPAKLGPNPTMQAAPFPGYKDPKQEGWGEWFVNNITGRSDPRFADAAKRRGFEDELIAEIFKQDLETGNTKAADEARSALRQWQVGSTLTPDEEAHQNIIKNALGPRFVKFEKDAYGAPVVVWRDGSGLPVRDYINRPGLSTEDVDQLGRQSLPYILAGRVAGGLTKGTGLLTRAATQAGFMGGTSLAGDIAAMFAGSEKAPDVTRAGVVAAGGAVGEALAGPIGRLIARLRGTKGLVDETTGLLTPKGAKIAKEAGFDPQDIGEQLGKQFAGEFRRMRASAGEVGTSMRLDAFDIPATRGQVTKDPSKLLNEKAMRYGAYGDPAKNMMQGFDQRQAAAIERAVMGPPGEKPSLMGTIAPHRAGAQPPQPAELGGEIKNRVQLARRYAAEREDAAWQQVRPIVPSVEALDRMPAVIQDRIGPMRVDDKLTPKAWAMAQDLEDFITGAMPKPGPAVLGAAQVTTVDEMRRRLGLIYRGAQDPTDVAAAKAIYEGFNDWIKIAADEKLMSRGAHEAAVLRSAIDRSRELREVFAERDVKLGATPGRKLMQSLLADDGRATPEAVIAKLFPANTKGPPPAGVIEALRLIKRADETYLSKQPGVRLWDDIRAAYLLRVVQEPNGTLRTPHMLAQRIEEATRQHATLMRELYKPEEIALIRQFGGAMRDIAYKDPNPSGSGTANAFYQGQFGQAVLRLLGGHGGPLSRMFQLVLGSTPMKNAIGTVAAQSATNATIRGATPAIGPIGGALTAREQGAGR